MLVELIPVIELSYYHDDVVCPSNGPSWKYASEWEEYNQSCLTKSGFASPWQSYAKGMSLYPIMEININNLTKLVMDEIQDMIAETILVDFAKQLIEVNEREQLKIAEIDKLLIYGE